MPGVPLSTLVGAGLSSRSGSRGAITHLDKLSFPAARWLCTVRQRPLPALPPLPGSLGAVPPLLKASSPGGRTGAGFSPSRPSRSTASPAAAATLAPDRRVPLEAQARRRARGARGWRWGERAGHTWGWGGKRGGKTITDKRKKETVREEERDRRTRDRQRERERHQHCKWVNSRACRKERGEPGGRESENNAPHNGGGPLPTAWGRGGRGWGRAATSNSIPQDNEGLAAEEERLSRPGGPQAGRERKPC